LKGGVELANQPLARVLPQALAVAAMGLVLPLAAYPVLRALGRLSVPDAASIAAHYGSVSVGTYAVALAYLDRHAVAYESHTALFVAVLEAPAIVVGIILARQYAAQGTSRRREIAREVLLGKSVFLLLGGVLIGWLGGEGLRAAMGSFFFDLFRGFLALFLLEMGFATAVRLPDLRRVGPFLIGFGIVMPLASAVVGAVVGLALGLSAGGATLVAVMAASASYIAVPAAFRVAVPEANPGLSMAASLGVTFPFNVFVGIPLYHRLVDTLRTWQVFPWN
jgi:hypothetical protein